MSSPIARDTASRGPAGLRSRRRCLSPRRLAIAFAVLLVAALAWASLRTPRPSEVVVAAVRAAPLELRWSATGYVECRTAQVSAPQVGRLVAVEGHEGERVEAGQVLARLESLAEGAATRVQEEGVRVAEAQAEAARRAHQEAEAAHPHRVAQAAAQVAAARARWHQAQAALARSRNVARAGLAAARAQADAARARVADLESGARPEEIAEARAAFVAAESTVMRARAEKARQERLAEQGAVPTKAAEDASEALVQAEAAFATARERLALLRKGGRADEIAVARAQARAAEQQAAAAEAELNGLGAEERAVEEAAAAVQTAEAALAEARSTQARVGVAAQEARAAEARVGQSAAGVQQARAALSERAITAPFSGVIGRRLMDPGDVATPGQPVFSVVEVDRAWVAAEVDAQDLAAVRAGQGVTITAPAYPGRAFPGVVSIVGAQAIPQTEVRTGARVVRVRISLDPIRPAERPLLKPGMEVDAAGRAILAPRAILVPSDTILTDSAGAYVLLVGAGGVGARRVKTGFVGDRETEILSGLRAGELVVVKGKETVRPGDRVRVK